MSNGQILKTALEAEIDQRTKHLPDELAESANGRCGSDNNVLAAQVRVHKIVVPDAATADYDIVVGRKCEVIKVEGWKTGGAGAASNTYTLRNGANAISNAIDGNVADNAPLVMATRDDAQRTILEDGTLRLSAVKSGGNVAAEFYVHVMFVA